MKPGQMAVITSDARPDMRVTGKVRQVSPSLETTSRQGTAEAHAAEETQEVVLK